MPSPSFEMFQDNVRNVGVENNLRHLEKMTDNYEMDMLRHVTIQWAANTYNRWINVAFMWPRAATESSFDCCSTFYYSMLIFTHMFASLLSYYNCPRR